MYLVSLSNQTFLFKNGKESFRLEGRAISPKAPDWIEKNHYALKLREQGKVSFEIKKKLTLKEKLQKRCKELGIEVGDNTTPAVMEKKIAEREKELKDEKK